MQIHSVGIDLGKTTFHLVALSGSGKVLLRKKFTQKQLITFTANMQCSLIGMEACAGAHFLSRTLREQGHDVKLIPAQFVRPFVKSNKNDFLDAEAIAEAVDRQNMRFVPIKTDDQLDLQAIHRVRDRLIARRTSVINQLRAFLLERGMTFAKTPFKLRVAMPDILENADANLTPRMRNLVSLLWSEWKDLEQQIVGMNEEIEQIASSDPACQRLRQIPGIGPLVATARHVLFIGISRSLPFLVLSKRMRLRVSDTSGHSKVYCSLLRIPVFRAMQNSCICIGNRFAILM